MHLDNKHNAILVLLLLIIAALACEGTPAAMQILDQPVYVCPTATPRPTDTPAPTSVQPPIVVPPSGWATNTPIPGCVWNGFICATSIPYPGGQYTTPGYSRSLERPQLRVRQPLLIQRRHHSSCARQIISLLAIRFTPEASPRLQMHAYAS